MTLLEQKYRSAFASPVFAGVWIVGMYADALLYAFNVLTGIGSWNRICQSAQALIACTAMWLIVFVGAYKKWSLWRAMLSGGLIFMVFDIPSAPSFWIHAESSSQFGWSLSKLTLVFLTKLSTLVWVLLSARWLQRQQGDRSD
ncbi:MAG: hypothetical protein NT018_04410 [Armatimonadetes bacterium]|nr:hypothetical protein [Armatimonadota bacterium]